MENALDKGKKVCTTFMDPSKVFDTLNHNLLLAKPNTYCLFFQCDKICSNDFKE